MSCSLPLYSIDCDNIQGCTIDLVCDYNLTENRFIYNPKFYTMVDHLIDLGVYDDFCELLQENNIKVEEFFNSELFIFQSQLVPVNSPYNKRIVYYFEAEHPVYPRMCDILLDRLNEVKNGF